jgi:hypothetical protein
LNNPDNFEGTILQTFPLLSTFVDSKTASMQVLFSDLKYKNHLETADLIDWIIQLLEASRIVEGGRRQQECDKVISETQLQAGRQLLAMSKKA